MDPSTAPAPPAGTAQPWLFVPALLVGHLLALACALQTLLLARPALAARLRGAAARLLPRAVAGSGDTKDLPPATGAVVEDDEGSSGGGGGSSSSSCSDGGRAQPDAAHADATGKPQDARVLVVASPSDDGGGGDDDDDGRRPAAGVPLLAWCGVGVRCRDRSGGGSGGVKWLLREVAGEAVAGEMQVEKRGR